MNTLTEELTRLSASLFPQDIRDLFDALCGIGIADKQGIVRIDNDDMFEADGCDQLFSAGDHAVPVLPGQQGDIRFAVEAFRPHFIQQAVGKEALQRRQAEPVILRHQFSVGDGGNPLAVPVHLAVYRAAVRLLVQEQHRAGAVARQLRIIVREQGDHFRGGHGQADAPGAGLLRRFAPAALFFSAGVHNSRQQRKM